MSKLSDSEERKVIRTLFDENINVEAGAGTGKTHEMVTRIINGLEKNIFTIDKIVIITYTKSAAAEMKGRIIQKLKEFAANENESNVANTKTNSNSNENENDTSSNVANVNANANENETASNNANANKNNNQNDNEINIAISNAKTNVNTNQNIISNENETASNNANASINITPTSNANAKDFKYDIKYEKNIFSNQLKKINNARISTVHSFCQALLKERPVEAGFDPHFEIIEDNSEIIDEVLNILLEKTLSKTHKTVDKNYIEIGELFKELLLENKYSIDDEYGYKQGYTFKKLIKILVQYRELEIVNPKKLDFETEKNKIIDLTCKYINLFNQFPKLIDKILVIKSFYEELNDADVKRTIEEINQLKYKPGNTGGKAAKELRDEWKNEYEIIKKRIIYALKYPDLKLRFERLQILFSEVKKLYNEILIKKSCIDFTGILMQTRDLLKNNPEVREYFRNKYTHYFIDEFQDTDPLQAEIVSYLCCKKDNKEKDWEKIEYEEGKLFIIGDPKQSIYKFGRADISIYSKMCSRISKKVELTTNFRSQKNIIDYVNKFFKDRIKKKKCYQPDYFDLNVRPDIDKNTDSKIISVSSTNLNLDLSNLKSDELREEEAKLTVCKLLQAKKTKLFNSWRDVTILFKHYSILHFLQKYLEGANIPYWVSGGRSYFARTEIKDLLVFLKALADPTDSLAVLATLKGPFFGFSDKEIWSAYKKDHWTFNYLKLIEDPENEIEEAFIKIKYLHYKTYNELPSHIINRIIYDPTFTATLYNTYRGTEKLKNLFKAAEFVRHHGITSFKEMVQILDKAVKEKLEMGDLDLNADTGDSVKLMTIHKAKGLQNKVIYLCDTTSNETRKNNIIQLDRKLYIGFDSFQCYTFPDIQAVDNEKNQAEVERLRYVVATRAENHFIFNDFNDCKNAKGNFVSHFFNNLNDLVIQEKIDTSKYKFNDVYISANEIQPEYDSSAEKEKNQWLKEYSDTKSKAEVLRYKKLSPSRLSDDILAEDKTIEIKFELKDDDYIGFLAVKNKSSDVLGNVVHKAMEYLEKVNENQIKNLIESLIKEYNLTETVENVLKIIKKIREHPVYKRSLKSKEVYRELPVKFTDEENNLYDGVIDLLFKENDKWILADYKISSNDEKTLIKKYEKQLRAYQFGLKQSGLCNNLDEIHIIKVSYRK